METLLEKLLTNGSPLVVLVLVVWMFLRYLQSSREKDSEMMKEMHNQHIEARETSRLALKENAEVTRANTHALQELARVVTRTIADGR
jgi:ABC-type nickel/cobalt efflux system permease component RcnA